jgi:SAM-dependent methyltransferase
MLAARLHRGASIADATDGAIDYRAPADATRTGFDPGSIDLVFSNSVLEHVYPDVLPAMFDEAMRILRPGGAAMHSVNCGDHYAYFDRKISQLHYLQFSESEWRLWNNEFQYQNRLRAKEFLAFALRAGFSIALDASEVRPSRLADLDKIEVAPEFAGYTREELALTNIDFVAKKPA